MLVLFEELVELVLLDELELVELVLLEELVEPVLLEELVVLELPVPPAVPGFRKVLSTFDDEKTFPGYLFVVLDELLLEELELEELLFVELELDELLEELEELDELELSELELLDELSSDE